MGNENGQEVQFEMHVGDFEMTVTVRPYGAATSRELFGGRGVVDFPTYWEAPTEGERRARNTYHCTFCGKDQDAVKRMIAGPNGVFICDECVELCREIIDEEQPTPPTPDGADEQSDATTDSADAGAATDSEGLPPADPGTFRPAEDEGNPADSGTTENGGEQATVGADAAATGTALEADREEYFGTLCKR